MPDHTEGLSPLEHFNLVMDEIRAGRGLAGTPTEEETVWRRDLAPAHVEGVQVLMVVISRHGAIANSVENYELLLKATYGDGGWIGKGYVGEQDPNVKIQGAGFPSFVEFKRKLVKGKPHTRDENIGQEELSKIIYAEAVLAGEYDQIHIVGHGSRITGLWFYPITDEETGQRSPVPFDEEKTIILCKYHSWPLKPGGRVLLVGCDADKGDFKAYIERATAEGEVKVYAVSGPWECLYGCMREGGPRIGALDWFHPRQHSATRAIGEELNLKPARKYD